MSEGSGRLNDARCPQFCRKRQNRLPHAPLRGAFGVIDPSASPARRLAHLQLQQMDNTMFAETTTYSVLDLGLTDQELLAHMATRRAAASIRARRPRSPEYEAELLADLDKIEASWGR